MQMQERALCLDASLMVQIVLSLLVEEVMEMSIQKALTFLTEISLDLV
jgi:hypothetical protein